MILRDLTFAINLCYFALDPPKKIMQNKDSRKKKKKKNSPQKKFTLFGHWNDSAACNAKLRYWNNGLLKLELLWSKQIEKISP